eukprot:SAG11_NODE_11292_length_770_cov_3.548435_1_plen_103_part_01
MEAGAEAGVGAEAEACRSEKILGANWRLLLLLLQDAALMNAMDAVRTDNKPSAAATSAAVEALSAGGVLEAAAARQIGGVLRGGALTAGTSGGGSIRGAGGGA